MGNVKILQDLGLLQACASDRNVKAAEDSYNRIKKHIQEQEELRLDYERLLVEIYAQAPQDEDTRKLIDKFDHKIKGGNKDAKV